MDLSPLKQIQLEKVESYTKSLGLDWSFELDGCDQRARTLVVGLMQDLGVKAGIIKFNDSVSLNSRFIPWHPEISWGHHTAAFVKVEEQFYVLDYALFDKPVLKEEWLQKIRSPYLTGTVDVSFEDYLFNDSRLPRQLNEWNDIDLENFYRAQMNPVKLKHMDLPSSKTEINFILLDLLRHTFRKVHINDQYTFLGEDFLLENLYPSAKDALDNIDQSTRCVHNEYMQTTDCTSYLKIERETCYFKFQIHGEQLAGLDNDLVCF